MAVAKQEVANSIAVAGRTRANPRATFRRRVAVIALIVICAGGTGFVIYAYYANQRSENMAYQVLKTNINIANLESQNAEVVALGQNFLKEYPKPSKARLYFIDTSLAIAYINANNDQAALPWQLSAMKNASPISYGDYMNLANIYYSLGDKADALQNYKLALNALSTVKGNTHNAEFVINQRITALEQAE